MKMSWIPQEVVHDLCTDWFDNYTVVEACADTVKNHRLSVHGQGLDPREEWQHRWMDVNPFGLGDCPESRLVEGLVPWDWRIVRV